MILSPRDTRFAYGLRIASDFVLPDLPASDSDDAPDISIELGPVLPHSEVERLTAPDSLIENVMTFEDNECRVLFSAVGRFSMKNGEHVFVEPVEGTTESSWRLPLLGSALALLLEQRSLFALHAGAVEMSGPGGIPVACAFAGEKGQGKSTLGAALSVAGFPLLCDDVLALQMPPSRAEPALALRGFGGMKLVPDAVQAVLNRSPDELPPVAPELREVAQFDKRHFVAPLATQGRPLRHIFLLASHGDEPDDEEEEAIREDVTLRALAPQEALAHLLPHTFAARWGDLYLKGARRATHFKACAQVVGSCRVWELSRRRDLKLIPGTIELITRTVRETA